MNFKKKIIVFSLFSFLFFSLKLSFPDVPIFRFVDITDIHFLDSETVNLPEWKERSKNSNLKYTQIPQRLKEFCSWVNKNNIGFVVITGDVLENIVYVKKSLPEFMEIMKNLKVPYFIVPGNHDFHLEKYLPEKLGGVDFYFLYGGMIFIGIPTSNIMCTAQGDLVLKQSLEKIAALTEKNKNNPIVIMCHHPLYPGKKVNPDFVPVNAKQVREVLEKSGNIFLVLQGHLHKFTDDTENGIRYITAPGFIVGPSFSFIVWNVYKDRLEGKIMMFSDQSIKEKKSITVKIPPEYREKIRTPRNGEPVAKPMPEAKGKLTEWFGKKWSYYPGGTPVIWKNEKVILKRGSSGWKFVVAKEDISADSEGKKWFEESYNTDDKWENVKLPVFYGKYRNIAKEGTELKRNNSYYFRLVFYLKNPEKNKKAMLRVASDKCTEVYLNGKIIDKDKLFHWAEYWNRYVIFNSSLLKDGKNTLAVKLTNFPSCTTGFLDVEIAIQSR